MRVRNCMAETAMAARSRLLFGVIARFFSGLYHRGVKHVRQPVRKTICPKSHQKTWIMAAERLEAQKWPFAGAEAHGPVD